MLRGAEQNTCVCCGGVKCVQDLVLRVGVLGSGVCLGLHREGECANDVCVFW